MFLHASPRLESLLRKHNFIIPKFPKTGKLFWNNKFVGSINNGYEFEIISKKAKEYIENELI